ncbi:MAG: hypothetical protein MI861_00170, partial [Pirellulales bacterium]|nr:hypothetical protein [Pirellulales bacterium]
MQMSAEDSYEPPFQSDQSRDEAATRIEAQSDQNPPESVLDVPSPEPELSPSSEQENGEDSRELIELAQPFVGQWNRLISKTNWEKGQIIGQWRKALVESGAEATQYSDDAWARRVG